MMTLTTDPTNDPTTSADLPGDAQLDGYADLIVRVGLNLQPGQAMTLSAEMEHAPFARRVVAAAYRAGARYVEVTWRDDLTDLARLTVGDPANLEYVPDYLVARSRQLVDEGWPACFLVGPEAPHALDDVAPARIAEMRSARRRKLRFYSEAQMANILPWTIAGVPTLAWAQQVFPDLPGDEALARLWATVLMTVRADTPDPVQAWREHSARLEAIATALNRSGVRTLHFVDGAPGPDGRPATDLAVGLTEKPVWIAAGSTTPKGVGFMPNIPTEEIFTTPHLAQVEGYVRTSKPNFPLDREVRGAYFRFAAGELVEYSAETGEDVLDEFFKISGTRRLGEISLVDERSPINRTGLIFHEILFDENCVSHMAFGDAYPGGTQDGASMTEAEREAAGVNRGDAHSDFMIGTATMNVTGIRADGSEVTIMQEGRIVMGADGA